MKKLYLLIGFIYTKLILGIILLLSLLNLIKGELKGELGFPPKDATIVWLIWIPIFLIIIIINIIDLIKYFLKNDIETIKKYSYKIKLFLIPYWILNFIISGAYWGILIGSSHGFGMFLLPVPFISAIFIFAITSIYSILFILLYWKNEKIKNGEFIIYLSSQFIFILDIIFLIIIKNRKN